MKEIWISHDSIENWSSPEDWTLFLEGARRLLGASLTHLDINDPVRRKVPSLHDAGQFICAFGPNEQSRWLFGKFKSIGVDFSVQHYRTIRHYCNTFMWHLPLSHCQAPGRWEIVKKLFSLGNVCLRPFYSYTDTADTMAAIAAKKRMSGAIDIQAELLGVFWLTYFNAAYVEFFGRERFAGLPAVQIAANGGIAVELAETPDSLSQEDRDQAVAQLGRISFVDVADPGVKRRGQFALTFEQLMNSCKR